MSKIGASEIKNKAISWLKNPYNLSILAIILLAFFIRVYFYNFTNDQPLWYDEAEYMSTSKHWGLGVPFDLNPQRPPLFQFLAALAFMSGLGEHFIRFFLVLIPSVALAFFVYLLGKEMFNKKIGLIASFLSAVSWTWIFWTARVQPDFFSVSFQVLSILFMWKYWKTDKNSLALYAGVFSALGFYFKISALLVPLSFLLFILLKERLSAFTNKGNYLFAASYFATLVPYFIWSKITFGTFAAFRTGYDSGIVEKNPFAWYVLSYLSVIISPALKTSEIVGVFFSNPIYGISSGILFILFVYGLVRAFKFLFYIDVLVKDKKKVFDSEIFSIIVLIVVSAFYIFYIRGIEDRWVFLWLPFMFFFIGSAILSITNKISSKSLGIILIIFILLIAGYSQVKHANDLILNKKDTYSPIRDAALWVKANSNRSDGFVTISFTQSAYYSEDNVTSYHAINSAEELDSWLKANKPKFIEISLFEPHRPWIIQTSQQNGYEIIAMQYFNSSIVMQNGNIVNLDLKQKLERNGITFTYVYPKDTINGVFVYEIEYLN